MHRSYNLKENFLFLSNVAVRIKESLHLVLTLFPCPPLDSFCCTHSPLIKSYQIQKFKVKRREETSDLVSTALKVLWRLWYEWNTKSITHYSTAIHVIFVCWCTVCINVIAVMMLVTGEHMYCSLLFLGKKPYKFQH